jgi:DNA (cytosine-5)-methyltransferase 1
MIDFLAVLDLYCGAGGAAVGYDQTLSEAGIKHTITGIDIKFQKRYPFRFIQDDALEYLAMHGAEYDFIHASPMCQGYANVTRWRGNQDDHPKQIPATREALVSIGKPWVIENVKTTALDANLMLCGSMFGLRVIRHRYFEIPWLPPVLLPACNHLDFLPFMHKGERAYADAMGCTWMGKTVARQAIPPAYCKWIMQQWLRLYHAS